MDQASEEVEHRYVIQIDDDNNSISLVISCDYPMDEAEYMGCLQSLVMDFANGKKIFDMAVEIEDGLH